MEFVSPQITIIPKKYFTNEALDYFSSKVCKTEQDKSMSLSYYIFKYFSIFCIMFLLVMQRMRDKLDKLVSNMSDMMKIYDVL